MLQPYENPHDFHDFNFGYLKKLKPSLRRDKVRDMESCKF